MNLGLLWVTKDRTGSRRAARAVVATVALCALALAPALGAPAPPAPATPPFQPTLPASAWTPRVSGTTRALAAVTFAGGRFVAVGLAGTILVSPDGVNWTGEPSGTSASLDGVAFGGKFVAVGFNSSALVSEVLVSPDGRAWTEVVSPLFARVFLEAVTYGGGKFVAVGTNGSILASADGIAWTSAASGTVAVLHAVAYGGGRFVAVGEGGVIFTSPDGTSWAHEASGTSGALHGIAYGGGRFVAVGPNAAVTSADGVHWTAAGTGVSGMYAVAYGDGQFVAVGDRGSGFASGDGSAWGPGPDAVAGPRAAPLLSGVTYGAGQFVAVAEDGGIWSITAPMATVPPAPPASPAAAGPAQGPPPAPPVVRSVTPSTGPSTGGTTITIAGSGLAGATQVTFQPEDDGTGENGLDCNASALRAAKIVSTSDAQVVAVTPAVGTPDASLCSEHVVVTTPAGSSPLAWEDRFLYLATGPRAPTVASVSPRTGPAAGGTQVTITGEGFAAATGVSFGGLPAAFSIKSDSTIIAVAPPASAAAGTVDVTVTASQLASETGHADQFAYDASGEVYLAGFGWSTPPARFRDLAGYAWAAAAIDDLAARGVVQGAAPGRFEPGAPVTRAQFAVMAQRLFGLPEPSRPASFTDVHPGEWDYGAVEAVAAYLGASGPHAFGPGDAAVRQDVAAAILRILAARGSVRLLNAAQAQAALDRLADKADIAPRLRIYAATAIQDRIMLGFPDGSFKPKGQLTRAQAAVLLSNVQTRFLHAPPSSPAPAATAVPPAGGLRTERAG